VENGFLNSTNTAINTTEVRSIYKTFEYMKGSHFVIRLFVVMLNTRAQCLLIYNII